MFLLFILRLFGEEEGISGESEQQKAINTADDCKDKSTYAGVGRNVCIRSYGNLLESVGLERIERRRRCLVKVLVDISDLGLVFLVVCCHQIEYVAILVVIIHFKGFVKTPIYISL